MIPYQISSLCYSYFLSILVSDPFIGYGFFTTFNSFISYFFFLKLRKIAFYIFPHITGAYYLIYLLGLLNHKSFQYNKYMDQLFGWKIILLLIGQAIFYLFIATLTYQCWYKNIISPKQFKKQRIKNLGKRTNVQR